MPYLLAWIPVGVLFTALTSLAPEIPWTGTALVWAPMAALYAFVNLSPWQLCRVFPLSTTPWSRLVAFGIAAPAVTSAAWLMVGAAWASMLSQTVSPQADEYFFAAVPLLFVLGFVLYALSIVGHYLLISYEETRRAERKALESQLLAREIELKVFLAQRVTEPVSPALVLRFPFQFCPGALIRSPFHRRHHVQGVRPAAQFSEEDGYSHRFLRADDFGVGRKPVCGPRGIVVDDVEFSGFAGVQSVECRADGVFDVDKRKHPTGIAHERHRPLPDALGDGSVSGVGSARPVKESVPQDDSRQSGFVEDRTLKVLYRRQHVSKRLRRVDPQGVVFGLETVPARCVGKSDALNKKQACPGCARGVDKVSGSFPSQSIGLLKLGLDLSRIDLPRDCSELVNGRFRVRIAHRAVQRASIKAVADDGIGSRRAQVGCAFLGPCHACHIMPFRQKSGNQGATDHPGRAGEKDPHLAYFTTRHQSG